MVNNSHCARMTGVVIERHRSRQAKHGHGGGRIIPTMSSHLTWNMNPLIEPRVRERLVSERP